MNTASETVNGAPGARTQHQDIDEQRAALADRIGYLLARAWIRRRESQGRTETETSVDSTSTDKAKTASEAAASEPGRTHGRRV